MNRSNRDTRLVEIDETDRVDIASRSINRHVYNTFINMTSRSPSFSPTFENNLTSEQLEREMRLDIETDNIDKSNITPDPVDHDELIYNKGLQDLENYGLTDIGNLASWEISSFKSGYDLQQLRDESSSTYWQSDGQQPHNLIIRFTKCVSIKLISIFLNFAVDESYTPDKIAIFAGTGEHDLIQVKTLEFFEPIGWQNISFEDVSNSGLLKCYLIKINFISNHQNGKDCHVRGIKIMSPIQLNLVSSNDEIFDDCVGFTSKKILCESLIR
jgi:anaphase-promoting complex subunit 10